ncbi:hypothetical protein DYB36_001419 [Aphanomyces astaci]|uniref:Uncharacterized protein n=1 Tax=Aphanomyces astaci TaxID=112090 RepID=A0A397B7W5_APHAT|nr:hypothetical protein DYB36_001419 [Aphanomyces astaci]
MLGTLSSILQSNWSAPSETILFARIDLTDDIPSTSAGMHHMLIDACSIACASSDDCEDDGSTQISATLRYAMCDAASPRQCAGNHMNQLVVIYTTYAVLWVLAGIVWAGHTYRSRAPVFKLHVIMSLTLATKVIATGTASLAFLVSRMDATLAYLRLAEIMQLGVTCLMMLVVFGLSDGCDIVGVHDRGFLLAILYFGYSLVESADSWNPILSAVMVLCILFMITTLSTKRLNELHTYAYALQQAGLNPDASPLGTKVRLLRAARLYSVLYFLETYCVTLDYWICDALSGDCAGKSYGWHRGVTIALTLVWTWLVGLWLRHIRRGPRLWIHLPLTLLAVLKVAHNAVVCSMFDPAHLVDELIARGRGRVADALQRGFLWLLLAVVFTIADGFGTLWLNVRGMQSLASKRQRVLFSAWLALDDAGIDPTTTAIDTKRRVLHRFVRVCAIYFATKFVLDVVFLCVCGSHSWLVDATHEALLLGLCVAVGLTFQCREFHYQSPSLLRLLLLPLPRGNEYRQASETPAALPSVPKLFAVFSHPDGTTAFGEQIDQPPPSTESLDTRQPSIPTRRADTAP